MSKVLIVDDDPVNRQILRIRLKALGHDVAEAFNGLEGCEKAGATMPDLILMDVMMPRLDGWGACRRMKADPLTRLIPVVILSAGDECPEAGSCADGVMRKPLRADDLRRILADYLPLGAHP